ATLESQLAHEGMGERMKEHIAQARIAQRQVFHMPGLAPLHVSFHEGAIMMALGYTIDPVVKNILTKFDEDTLTPHLGSGYPGWSTLAIPALSSLPEKQPY